MPAGITETDSMAYVGQKPWHNLGVKVEGDAMTASEAIEATVRTLRKFWQLLEDDIHRCRIQTGLTFSTLLSAPEKPSTTPLELYRVVVRFGCLPNSMTELN